MVDSFHPASEQAVDRFSADTLAMAKRRAPILLFIFGLWAIIITFRLFQVMVLDRDEYLRQMTASSWHQGTILAIRGRILDKDGNPLAWSTRHFRVVSDPPRGNEFYRQQLVIRETFDLPADSTPPYSPGGATVTIRPDLAPQQFALADRLATEIPEVRIEPYFKRHRHPDPRIRTRLGEVAVQNGMEVGTSGAELEHDSLLRGRPGLFRVMLTPAGEWLPGTWEQIRAVKSGYDVYLPVRFRTVAIPEGRQ